MRHRAALRRLPQLLDHTLPVSTERVVWAHVDACDACQERLAEHQACGRLLERLPAGLIPLSGAPAGEQRLMRLARWSPTAAPRGEGPETAALAVAAAALALVVVLAGARSSWVPFPDTTASAAVQVAYVLPGAVRAP